MKLVTLLQEWMPSKEAKARLLSGKILINNEVVRTNIDLDIQDGYWDYFSFFVDNDPFLDLSWFNLTDFNIKNFLV
jgi:hypothetical protein